MKRLEVTMLLNKNHEWILKWLVFNKPCSMFIVSINAKVSIESILVVKVTRNQFGKFGHLKITFSVEQRLISGS